MKNRQLVDDAAVGTFCERHLLARPVDVLFRAGHLSSVTGLRLTDGRHVVVKVRPAAERVYGCVQVQRALARAGFGCPAPLGGPEPLGDALITAEEYRPGGEPLPPRRNSAELFAGLLAELLRLAPAVSAVAPLTPSPPWVGWDRPADRLWPEADDLDVDLNEYPGPTWLDDLAAAVRARLADNGLPAVVGHGDWESQNIRWRGRRAWAVHDWDSVVAQPEAAIVGQAAAVWAAEGQPDQASSLEQSERFLGAYEDARGATWTGHEREIAWAAGLWVRAFNAKKDSITGGPQLDLLATDVHRRMRHAGL